MNDLLSDDRQSPLARLLRHSSRRDAWTAQLRAFLPPEVGAECQVANVRDHVLTVHINNAAWATRLRFTLPELVPQLNQLADFAAVSEIRLKVEPFDQTPLDSRSRGSVPAARPRAPDGKTLTDFANTLEYDQIREAILRLARHGEVRTTAQVAPGSETDASDEQVRRAPTPDRPRR